MKQLTLLTAAAATLVLATSCSKLGPLTAENFSVTPSPLEAVASQVPATVNGRFPEKYMKRKAVVTVTPELRYQGGKAVGQPATFQGEKVMGNDQTISYQVGGNYTLRDNFAYLPEMQQSELYLTFQARLGKKVVNIPEVKVADGVIATSELIRQTAGQANMALGEDKYQYIIKQQRQATINYLVNQSKVRSNELKKVSVQDFVKMLREIKADERGLAIEGVDVSAYASPEGSLAFNTKLSEQRQNTGADFVKKQLKETKLKTDVTTRYTAEDWEGFQELVSKSNMQDKDVILRVLSMYQDPEQREAQIRALSSAFTELADEVLPELRRARLTLNYNVVGRTDDEIEQQLEADPSLLSVEELLYAASLKDNNKDKRHAYEQAAKIYPTDYRALNNLAILAQQEGDTQKAEEYLSDAARLAPRAAEVGANRALLALCAGQVEEAENLLADATTAKNYNEVMGNINVAKGNYQQAAKQLEDVATNSTVLAQILAKDYASAMQTITSISEGNALTDYLLAIAAARMGNADVAASALRSAVAKDSSLRERAAKDLEFAHIVSQSPALRGILK